MMKQQTKKRRTQKPAKQTPEQIAAARQAEFAKKDAYIREGLSILTRLLPQVIGLIDPTDWHDRAAYIKALSSVHTAFGLVHRDVDVTGHMNP